MAELNRMSDAELEQALRTLGSSYPYPPTPDIHLAVSARIARSPRRAAPGLRGWRKPQRLALVALVAMAILAAVLFVNPFTRDAIAHFFQVRGVVVTRTSATPSVSPLTSLNLGQPTTLEKAQAAVTFKIAIPPELGRPDAVYIDQDVPGGEVALAYKPRPGIAAVRQTGLGVLITEFRGDLIPEFIAKEVGPDTTAEEVSVHGDPGWWIAGQPHVIVVRVSDTTDTGITLRMAANTLVWDHSGVTYRIESGLDRTDAMKLAEAMP